VPEDPLEPLVPLLPLDPLVPLEPAVPLKLKAYEAVTAYEEVPTNVPLFNRIEPVTTIPPVTSSADDPTGDFPIPTLLPVTTSVLLLNLPITTLSSLNTSSIGNPETSLTAIKLPDKLSTTLNSDPELPTNATLPDGCASKRIVLTALPLN
jgi:hypothetical protein